MKNISYYLLLGFYFLALLNPVLKKYDYGAGFPLVVVLAILAFAICVVEFKKSRERGFFDLIFLSTFVVFFLLSFVFSQTRNVGFSEVMAFGSASSLYFILSHTEIKWMDKFLRATVFGAFLAVLVGFFLYFTQGEVRMFGSFFNILYHANNWPNAFALFLLMVWPLAFVVPRNKSWQFVLFSLLISALILTYSRGAMIAFAGQSVLILAYFWRRIKLKTVAILVGVVLAIVIIFFGGNYIRSIKFDVVDASDKIAFQNGEKLTSGNERIEFWKGAIQLAGEKPLLGWGPFSFRHAYNSKQHELLATSDHPHNIFLKIAAENGFVAMGSFILFLISVFAVAFGSFKRLPAVKRDLIAVLGISVVGALAHNLIDYNFNFIVNLMLLFLFVAFIRSLSIQRLHRVRKISITFAFTFVLMIFAIFEGSLLFLNQTGIYKDSLGYSLYPRNYHIAKADEVINGDIKLLDTAITALNREISLNPLDDRAYYLKGVALCKMEDLVGCKLNFEKAIYLNPLNDLQYYSDYVSLLRRITVSKADMNFVINATNIVWRYFDFVDKNVHFTAYSQNVEAASSLVDNLKPFLAADIWANFDSKRKNMLEVAGKLRNEKKF